MKKLTAVLALLLSAWALPAWAKTDIEFVFDASGSMRAAMSGSTQMDVAKKTIKETIATLPPDTHVALRVYAHRMEQSNKELSCVDTELLVPFGPLDASAFSAKVDSIQPKGYTPIAYSLSQVGNDFGVEREADKVIILVSDGEETCGGDPVQAVKDLIAKGFKLKLHAVGFNVDPKTQAQLQAIATAGNGQYYDARDGAALSSALQKITQEALLIQKTTATYGAEIKGGDSYETAVVLTPGTEYKLNHHQRQNQFDYFYVDLKAGQQMTATLGTLGKGVSIQGELAQDNANPYAGFQIHDANRTKLVSKEIIGAANHTETLQVDAAQNARFYLLIGSTYDHMNKECPFKVTVGDFFDAGTQGDAGDTMETALAIEKTKPVSGAVMSSDTGDVYKINTVKGEPITVAVMPENQKATLKAILSDDMRVQLAEARSPNEGAGFRLSGTATGPTTYLRVQRYYNDDPATKYTLTFEGASAATTAAAGVDVVPVPSSPITPPTPTTAPQTEPKPDHKRPEPPDFTCSNPRVLKIIAIAFGTGLLPGLIAGFVLRGVFRKKQPPAASS